MFAFVHASSNKQDKLSISTCGLHNIEKNLVNINDTLIVHIARKPAYTKDDSRASSTHMHRAFIGLVRAELLVCAVYSVGTQYNIANISLKQFSSLVQKCIHK